MKSATRKKFKVLTGFRLAPDLVVWLDNASERTGKTKTRILEDALRARMVMKMSEVWKHTR